MLTRIAMLLVALLSLSFASSVQAAPKVQAAVELIEETSGRVARLVKGAEEASSLRASLDTLLGEIVDFRRFGQRTLSGHWEGLNATERERFEQAFRALVLSLYAKRFTPGMVFTTSLRGSPERLEADRVKVFTTVSGPKAGADVDYELSYAARPAQAAWRVSDLVIDGVSMVQNWRNAFKRILDRDGFEALVTKIERRASRP